MEQSWFYSFCITLICIICFSLYPMWFGKHFLQIIRAHWILLQIFISYVPKFCIVLILRSSLDLFFCTPIFSSLKRDSLFKNQCIHKQLYLYQDSIFKNFILFNLFLSRYPEYVWLNSQFFVIIVFHLSLERKLFALW